MARRRRMHVALGVGILAAAVLLVLWLAPEDRTLGVHTKLVFFHGALILASLLLYGVAAVAALVYLWNEPRVMANAAMLLVSLVVVGVALLSANRRGVALLYAVAAGLFAIMISQAGRGHAPRQPHRPFRLLGHQAFLSGPAPFSLGLDGAGPAPLPPAGPRLASAVLPAFPAKTIVPLRTNGCPALSSQGQSWADEYSTPGLTRPVERRTRAWTGFSDQEGLASGSSS